MKPSQNTTLLMSTWLPIEHISVATGLHGEEAEIELAGADPGIFERRGAAAHVSAESAKT